MSADNMAQVKERPITSPGEQGFKQNQILPNVPPEKEPEPKKTSQRQGMRTGTKVILAVGAGLLTWTGLGTFTELTDKKPFNDPQVGIVQKAGYDMFHPLGWIGNIRINKPIIETTVTPTVDKFFPNKLDTSSFTPITSTDANTEIGNTQISDIKNHTIKMLLPIDQETLDGNPDIKYNQIFNATLPPYVDQTGLENVKNLIQIDGLPDGKIARTTLGGTLRVIGLAGQSNGLDQKGNKYIPSYSEARIDLTDKDGTPLTIIICVLGGIPLFDPSQAPFENSTYEIKAGQPLFKISKDNASGGSSLPTENGQIIISAFYQQQDPRASIPLTIDFLNQLIVK